jgi:type II secretory pathway pseudopilin PulG
MFFAYSKKIIIILSISSTILLGAGIFLLSKNQSRANDLAFVSQAQILATSLENYFDQANQYPVLAETDVAKIRGLSEKGWNQNGENIFYTAPAKFLRSATLVVDKDSYSIKFNLKNSWKTWSLTKFSGGDCKITNNIQLSCL